MSDKLERELQTYEEKKSELLSHSEGKYVLIKDTELVGVFDSYDDAIRQGYERLGNVAFLVKQVEEIELPVYIVSNLL